MHNVLRAHAAAVTAFRSTVPGGRMSMNINGDWAEPYDVTSRADVVRPTFRGFEALLLKYPEIPMTMKGRSRDWG